MTFREYRTDLLVLAGALIFVTASFLYAALFPSDVREITIETEHLPRLLPHPHSNDDSPSDEGHHVEIESSIFTAPEDLWVTGLRADLINAPDVALHHALLLNIDGKSPSCPLRTGGGQELFAFSQDQMHTNTMTFPEGYALFVPKGSRIVLVAAFHNPEPPFGPGEEYREVSVRAELVLAPADSAPLKKAFFHLLHLDDEGCVAQNGGYTFTVPPHTKGYAYTGPKQGFNPGSMEIPKDARIVYIAGHLHGWQGGRSLALKRNGEVIENFHTERSASVPYRYDTPHHAANAALKAGDTLSIESVYDNPHDLSVRGAMGMLGIWIAED